MRSRDLSALTRVAGAACDAAQSRLARLQREEAELRRQIAALEAARRARAADALATDVALRAGVDLRWEGWIDRRASLLLQELARLRARIEIAREDLSRSFGRHMATEDLLGQALDAAAHRRLKAEERGW